VARRRQVSSPKYVTFVQLLLGNHVRAVINGTLTPSSQIFVRFFFSHFPLPRATSRHSGRFLYCTLFTTSFKYINYRVPVEVQEHRPVPGVTTRSEFQLKVT
jgi:hypothetical protein